MNRKRLSIAIAAAGAALIVLTVVLRHGPPSRPSLKEKGRKAAVPNGPQYVEPDGPVSVPQPRPDFKPADPVKLGKALDEASIQSLIDNLRVASEQGDDGTMRAMIEGLRRRGPAAHALVRRELAQLPADSASYYAFQQVIR